MYRKFINVLGPYTGWWTDTRQMHICFLLDVCSITVCWLWHMQTAAM